MGEGLPAVRMLQASRRGAFRSTAQSVDRNGFPRGSLHEILCAIRHVEAAVAILPLGSVPRTLSKAARIPRQRLCDGVRAHHDGPGAAFFAPPAAEVASASLPAGAVDSMGSSSDSLVTNSVISPSTGGRASLSDSSRTLTLARCGSGGGAAPGAGNSIPRRVRASSAFFFQSARRKRCAEMMYQRPASSLRPAFSSIAPSSHATIASRVR